MPTLSQADISWTYINLSDRIDRKAKTIAQMKQAGINGTRFPARRCNTFVGRDACFANFPNRGTVGCALSHLILIEKATEQEGIAGILEDDVMFCDDFQTRLRYIEEHFDKPWDVFFLNATFHLRPTWHRDTLGKDFELTDDIHFARVYGLWCTHSYLLNCQSAEKVLAVLVEKLPQSKALDHAFILSQPELNCYCFVPGMTCQFDNWSDITNSESKYSGFFPQGPHVFCNRLEHFNNRVFLRLVESEYSPNADD